METIEIVYHSESTSPAQIWWKNLVEYINGNVDRAQKQWYLDIIIVINIYFMLMMQWVK